MQDLLVYIHSILRWVILVLLVVSIYNSVKSWKSGKAFGSSDKKIVLFTMIFAHITLVIGIYQVFAGRFGILSTQLSAGESFMKNPLYRFYWVEHPLLMIIAIVLLTIANSQSKKHIADSLKFKKIFYFSLIALVLFLAAIPWPGREIIGRQLIPSI